MNEAGDQLAVTCPACSPDIEAVHEVLSGGGQPTVRCRDCGHVHTTSTGDVAPETSVRTIVSQDGESVTATVDIPTDALLEVGDRFVVDTDAAVYSVELTDIEGPDGRRQDRLTADDIETLWTRDIGNVAVDVTIHPADGSDEDSRSADHPMPGDGHLAVGEELTVDGEPVRVTGLLLREQSVPEGTDRRFDEPGDRAMAMDLDRVYARSQRRVRRDPW